MDTVCNCSVLLGHKEEGGIKSQRDIFWGHIIDTCRGSMNTKRKKERVYKKYI